MTMSNARERLLPGRGPAAAVIAALAMFAACKKSEAPRAGNPPAPGAAATEAPPAPPEDENRRAAGSAVETVASAPGRTPEPAALPREAASGGALIWVSAPNVARSIDRIAVLADAVRAAIPPSAAAAAREIPPGDAVKGIAEQTIRAGLLGEWFGLPDPGAIDLAAPVHARVSLPTVGAPQVVLSFGATKPLGAVRNGKIVGVPAGEGRYLVGLGVEPDPAGGWPQDVPADGDVTATIDVRAALPALVGVLRELQANAALVGGTQAPPPWLERLLSGALKMTFDMLDADKLTIGLRIGDADAPITFDMSLSHPEGSPTIAAWDAMVEGAPPFGLLDALDSGGTMWVAVRMNPAGVAALMPRMLEALGTFVSDVVPEGYRAQSSDLIRLVGEMIGTMDGRAAFRGGPVAGDRTAFTTVYGVTGPGARATIRGIFGSAADLLAKLLADVGITAQVQWQQAVAKVRGVEIDRLTIEVPRDALGPIGDALQPGAGPLRWEVSVAAGRDRVVVTTDTDQSVLDRALSGGGRGGGLAGGARMASRIAQPAPGLVEVGTMDLAADMRNNPMFRCEAARTLPSLDADIGVSIVSGSLVVSMTFLPGQVGNAVAFGAVMRQCTEEMGAQPASASPAVVP